MKKQFRDFEYAREFVKKLDLKNRREWREYVKSGNKPDDIPSDPYTYKNKFKGYGDWLGTGTVSVKDMQFQSFEDARKFAQKLGLKNRDEWFDYCKSGNNPDDIPRSAGKIYKKDFKGWGDFLGSGNVKPGDRESRSFEDAREFVRRLNLKGTKEWKEYCKSGKKPDDIPQKPESTFKKNWKGYGDWLGNGTVASQDMIFRSFTEARHYVRDLKLKNNTEWKEYCKSGNKPDDIPANPNGTFKKDFKGISDWLGNGNLSNIDRDYLSYDQCSLFAQKNNITKSKEWENFSKSDKRHPNIPGHPRDVYKKEWKGWGKFLGTGNIQLQQKQYRSFDDARKFIHTLNLKTSVELNDFVKSKNMPKDVPSSPEYVYKNKGWKSIGDWLGTGTVAPQDRVYRQYHEAREFVRALHLKGTKEWFDYCKSGNKPDDIPTGANNTYKKEWKSWGDWLGNEKVFRPFKEARKFVRKLGLKTALEWNDYCKSGNKPDDIPSTPWNVYNEWNKK